MKRVIVIIFLLLLPLTRVYGYGCPFEELAEYKDMAANITTSYDYIGADDITFSVTLTNLKSDLYIVDTLNDNNYMYRSDEMTISGYKPGQVVKYNVYTTNGECNGKLLYTIIVNLPYYNKYYNDVLCEGISDYKYCRKWANVNLEYNDFEKAVLQYKQSLIPPEEKEEDEIQEEIEEPFWTNLLSIWVKYYYIVLPLIIVLSGYIIYSINKKENIYK